MKFDYCIGNPPYQGGQQGDSHYALPVYHSFMEAAYSIADKVELITPARFLFNAGQTPKEWNQKMLQDEHFKVLEYQDDAKKVFQNTDIKGGVSITYRDATKLFGAIKQFSVYNEINTILAKMNSHTTYKSIGDIINVASKFNLVNLVKDYPQLSNRERRLSSNVLLLECFRSNKLKDNDVLVYGVINNKRDKKYIDEEYIDMTAENIEKYKVILPKAEGNGRFGEIVTKPQVIPPHSAYTHTFYGIGCFEKEYEANNVIKYVKTKFARALLSILKVTQNVNSDTWKYVPLQDFTDKSDIDWSKSIYEIDQQLYKKYNLSKEEIEFIETHVKEMK